MMKSKSLIAVLFCCALFVCKPAKAFWPIFDFTEIAPIYSQISTGFESLKNLKDQLIELKDNLSAFGNSISGIATFAKDISDKVSNAAEAVGKATSVVNKTLGTDIKIGRDVQKALEGVAGATTTISNTATASTEYISGATSGIDKTTNVIDDVDDAKTKIDDKFNKKDETPKEETTTPSEDKKEEEAKTTTPAKKESVGDKIKKMLPKIIGKKTPIEEEEEEEEVSEAEDQLRIDSIKENIGLILSESEALSDQLNDLLDISINTLHKNSEENQKKLLEIEYVITRAQNIEDKDKKDLLASLSKIKEQQEKTSTRLVEVIEAVKDNYNQEYNSKVVDGYKNYEKIAIAYVRGDATKKELKDAGINLKKTISSISVSPDKSVMNNIENTIKTMQEDLILLENNVKKAEDKKVLEV